MDMHVASFVRDNDLFLVAAHVGHIWYMFELASFTPDCIDFYWTSDRRLEIYAIWHITHVETLSPDIPLFFKSTYPVSRFLYIVNTIEDLREFDVDLPAYLNNVSLCGHISGLKPYGYDVKLIYKVASINYGYFDWFLKWIGWL